MHPGTNAPDKVSTYCMRAPMQLCHRNPRGHKLKKHICLLEPPTHVPALPVWLDCAFLNSCFDWRSCQSRRAAVLQPSGGNGRLKLAATSRIPALQYKSVPKSFLCVKHKLCFPWSPNAGGHKKYLVNGAKKMSGDLNMFFLFALSTTSMSCAAMPGGT